LPVCIQRVQRREGKPSVDADALGQIWRSFAEVGRFEANVFELDGETIDEVSEALARGLEDGRLLV
jgi:hypothetical protein